MTIKFKPVVMLNLWKENSNQSGPKVVTGNYDAFCNKAIDGFCMEADLCESLEEYVETICDGMMELIKMGIPKQKLLNHSIALTKILRLGEDIIEYGKKKSDIFYIGLFVDLKIAKEWFEFRFYSVIKNMLNLIYSKSKELPNELKVKIELLLKSDNFPLYSLYFLKNREPSFKKAG